MTLHADTTIPSPLALDGGEAPAADADHTHESACLNCETPLVGPHCHMCGQTMHLHRNLTGFFHDIAHGVFHFEGRIWRTLPLLAWHPGQLTRAYIAGRRATYISPVAAFLFATFLMFAAIQFAGAGATLAAGQPIDKAIAGHTAMLDELVAHGTTAPPRPIVGVDPEADSIAQQRAILARLEKLRADGLRTVPNDVDLDPGAMVTHVGWLDGMISRAIADPALLAERVEGNAHKYAWALIPLSVPFVWLLFAFDRRWQLYDHSVFVTYSITFMTLLATAVMLAIAFGQGWLVLVAICVVPLHIHRQTREAYGLGHAGAAWRTVALTLFAMALFAGFCMSLVALGAAG